MKTISIEIPDDKRAEWINGVLTLVDEIPEDVTERIKTFDDARNELGEEHQLVKTYYKIVGTSDKSLAAYTKLNIIAAALNEDWKYQFGTNEYRWYPCFKMYPQEDIDDMDDDKKQMLIRFYGYAGSLCGFGFSYSDNATSDSDVYYGTHIAVKSKRLADYFGKQFISIWKDFLIRE